MILNADNDEPHAGGSTANMTPEQFVFLVNEAMTRLAQLTPELKQDRIRQIEEAIRKLKVEKHATWLSYQDDLGKQNELRRKELEKRDREYRMVERGEEPSERKTRASSAVDPREKMILKIMEKKSCSREDAIKFLDED